MCAVEHPHVARHIEEEVKELVIGAADAVVVPAAEALLREGIAALPPAIHQVPRRDDLHNLVRPPCYWHGRGGVTVELPALRTALISSPLAEHLSCDLRVCPQSAEIA